MKHPEQRVGVFIDVANLYYSAKALYGKKVNFDVILKEVVGERRLIHALAYVIKAENPDEQKFFDALENMGFEVKMKDLQIFYGGAKKGDWDVGIAIDAIRLAPKLDVVVLVSGDGDFLPLLEYLRGIGQRVEVAAFGRSASRKLVEAADEFLDLDKNKNRFLIVDRKAGARTRSTK